MFYGLEGGKDLVVHKWRHLMDSVRLVCTLEDGSTLDLTDRLRSYGAHALLFLNIRSYSGGARPWKGKAGVPSPCDGLVEVSRRERSRSRSRSWRRSRNRSRSKRCPR